jgi:hypothetical protein
MVPSEHEITVHGAVFSFAVLDLTARIGLRRCLYLFRRKPRAPWVWARCRLHWREPKREGGGALFYQPAKRGLWPITG